jgi:hypothetical protein
MKNVSRFLVFCAGLLALWNSFLQEAQAVPSYTRRYGVECARCHSVWGGLTGAGNTFKLSGYRAINGVPLKPESEDIELAHGTLTIPTTLPLSFITGVGYDWRSEKREPAGAPSRDATGSTLALEDASIFLTSPIGNHLAAFVEFPMYESRAWEFTPTGEADVHAKVPSHIQFPTEQPGFEVAKFFWNNLAGDALPRDSFNLLFGITHLPLAYSPGKVRIPVNQDLIYERRALDLISPNKVSDMLGTDVNDRLFRLSEPQGLLEGFGMYALKGEVTDVSKKETPWLEYHLGISNGNNAKASAKADKDFYGRVTLRWYMQSVGFFAYHSNDTYDDDLRATASRSGNPGLGIMSGLNHSNSRNTFGPNFTANLGLWGIPVSLDNDVHFNRESDPTGFGQSFAWRGGFHQLNWFQSKETIAYARYDWISGDRYNDTAVSANGTTGLTLAEPREWDIVAGAQHLLNPNMKLIGEFRHHKFSDSATAPSSTLTDNGFTVRFMVGF